MENVATYRRVRERVVGLVRGADVDIEVPTTPGWSVKDTVGHLASFFAVYNTDGPMGFEPGWGEREVEARRDKSLDDLITEWGEGLDAAPVDLWDSPLGAVAVSDVLAHEQDIRNALGKPPITDDPGIVPSVHMALAFVDNKPEAKELPPLRVVTEDGDRQLGEGEPQITLRTTTFELFRTLHGRRTPDQARALDWDGDPGRWIEAIFIFGPAKEIVEKP